jgi:hypothetical protein
MIAFVVTAGGCGGGSKDGGRKRPKAAREDDDDKDGDKEDKPGPGDNGGGRTPVASTGWGTLKGTVTLDGEAPTPVSFESEMKESKDRVRCLMGPKNDMTWLVKTKEGKKLVENVVVWLDPGPGKYFKLDPSKKTWKDQVVLDQPYCAFEPRVQVVFPQYFDGKAMVKGQTFIVKNSANIGHNTSWKGDDRLNPGGNLLVGPGNKIEPKLTPDNKTVVNVSCTIHKWMRARVWALDHPYFAITDADGKFEIKNAPASAEVRVVVWHEAKDFITDLPEGGKVKLEDGKTKELNFSIKP